MQIQNLAHPFEIEFIENKESCPITAHKHTFFELVYTLKGEGYYHINGNRFPYRADNLFLLLPMDVNFCTVEKETSFLFIRFNNIYLQAQKPTQNYSQLGSWLTQLEVVLQHATHGYGCIVRHTPDKPLVRAVTEAIIQEKTSGGTLHLELVQQLVNTLLTVVARNIKLHTSKQTQVNERSSFEILDYIHHHIYEPDKLRSEAIADHFNISVNYVSEYFKKHTQHTLQQYIMNYKLSLVETRLRYSNLRMNEIASELGFTDESHLTKTFKKYRGITPALYRKSMASINS